MGSPDSIDHPTILFDGVCNLCTGSVLFIIKRDPAARFRFAQLQSAFGQRTLRGKHIDPGQPDTILLLQNDELLRRSTAALEIVRHLAWPWPILYALIVVPRVVRDWFYDLVSRNRYRIFGRKDECMIPTPELRSRFIE